MEYDIIQHFGTAIDFVEFVSIAIKLGWRPQGGVYCVTDNGAIVGYVQAMVRTEKPTPWIPCGPTQIPMMSEVEP